MAKVYYSERVNRIYMEAYGVYYPFHADCKEFTWDQWDTIRRQESIVTPNGATMTLKEDLPEHQHLQQLVLDDPLVIVLYDSQSPPS